MTESISLASSASSSGSVAPDSDFSLITTVGACGFCHSTSQEDVAIDQERENRNLEITGINVWGGSLENIAKQHSGSELRHFFRFGRYPTQNHKGAPFGHQGFEWLSEVDLDLVVKYLQSLSRDTSSSVEQEKSEHNKETGWLSSLFSESEPESERTASSEVPGVVPNPQKVEPVSYGQYLLGSLARCQTCHQGTGGWFSDGEAFAGGRIVENGEMQAEAPSLIDFAHELTVDVIENHLREGTARQGDAVNSKLCPTSFTRRMPTRERAALAAALQILRSE